MPAASESSLVRLIDGDLIKALPRANLTIRDTALRGFQIRVRHSARRGLTATYRVELGRGRVKSLGRVGVVKLKDAREAARHELGAKWTGQAVEAPTAAARPTFQQYLEDTYGPWLAQHQRHGEATAARLLAVFSAWRARPLDELSPWDVEQWRTSRRKVRRRGQALKATTLNRDLDDLRALFSRAVEWGHLARSPLAAVKRDRVDRRGVVRYLTREEEARLRTALVTRDNLRQAKRDGFNRWRRARGFDAWPAYGVYTDHLAPLVLLALNTGLRRGELLKLTWADVQLDTAPPALVVRGETAKSAQTRVIPLNSEARAVLRMWRPDGAGPAALVFPGTEGRVLGTIKTAWGGLCKLATITAFRFHDLRHTFASKLVQRGVDLNVVRELLGHADMKMTLRYAHLAPHNAAAAVALLEG